MNWKNKYSEIKVGDKVRIININMNTSGQLTEDDIGTIAKVTLMDKSMEWYFLDDNKWCANFTKENIEKVIQ